MDLKKVLLRLGLPPEWRSEQILQMLRHMAEMDRAEEDEKAGAEAAEMTVEQLRELDAEMLPAFDPQDGKFFLFGKEGCSLSLLMRYYSEYGCSGGEIKKCSGQNRFCKKCRIEKEDETEKENTPPPVQSSRDRVVDGKDPDESFKNDFTLCGGVKGAYYCAHSEEGSGDTRSGDDFRLPNRKRLQIICFFCYSDSAIYFTQALLCAGKR